MTKFLTRKITALVAMLAGSMVISGCGTPAGKPEICQTKASSAKQRCAAVNAPKAKPKAKAKVTRNKVKAAPITAQVETFRDRSNY